MQTDDFVKEFKENALLRMHENQERIHKSLAQITEEEAWKAPNLVSNSAANLILHLCGNITQYILSSLGESPDQRQRDLEFSIQGGLSKAELLEKIDGVLSESYEVIQEASIDKLLKIKKVQGFEFSGIGIITHVVEHLSYHTGQIAFWVKLLKNQDLGFYADVDLNKKNQ